MMPEGGAFARRRLLKSGLALAALMAPAVLRASPSARRIVSVGGAVTERIFALGAGERVIAVDSTSTFPISTGALPRIGYMRALPTEGLLALNPDTVLLSSEAGPPQALAVLRSTGLAMSVIPDRAGGAALTGKLTVIGASLGVDPGTAIAAVHADWHALDQPIAALRARPRALFVFSVSGGGPMISGRDTHANAMLEAAGAINPANTFSGYRPLSGEAAAALAPDVIVMMEHSIAAAFSGGLLACAAIARLGRRGGATSVPTLLLAGVAISALCSAGTGLMIFMADDRQVRDITFWTLGSLAGARWVQLPSLLVLIGLPMLALMFLARPLNALMLGEEAAWHLGVRVEAVKRAALVLAAVAASAGVAFTGPIAFIGLVVPHLVRLGFATDHRIVLPVSALLGAAMMMLADLAARSLAAPAELPIGVVTSLLGAPFFLWLLRRDHPGAAL